MEELPENFEAVIKRGEELYRSLGKISCPYFGKDIHFNTTGLEHLKFKSRNRARNPRDQYMRFKLFRLVPEVLRLSKTVQGIFYTKHFERIRVHSRTDIILKPVSYYEFVAVLENTRVKIIVKQIEDDELFFWSIIPFWDLSSLTKQRKLHSGNPDD